MKRHSQPSEKKEKKQTRSSENIYSKCTRLAARRAKGRNRLTISDARAKDNNFFEFHDKDMLGNLLSEHFCWNLIFCENLG